MSEDTDTRTFKITAPAAPLVGDLQKQAAGVQEPTVEAVERIKAQRKAVHDRLTIEAAQDAATVVEETGSGRDPDALPPEAVDSIEVKLPNGKIVEYGPRLGVSTSIKLAQLIGAQINPLLTMTMTTLLNVRSIDGAPPPTLNNLVDAQKLANMLEDSGLDVLGNCHVKFFPPVSQDMLPVLKKNLRGN